MPPLIFQIFWNIKNQYQGLREFRHRGPSRNKNQRGQSGSIGHLPLVFPSQMGRNYLLLGDPPSCPAQKSAERCCPSAYTPWLKRSFPIESWYSPVRKPDSGHSLMFSRFSEVSVTRQFIGRNLKNRETERGFNRQSIGQSRRSLEDRVMEVKCLFIWFRDSLN